MVARIAMETARRSKSATPNLVKLMVGGVTGRSTASAKARGLKNMAAAKENNALAVPAPTHPPQEAEKRVRENRKRARDVKYHVLRSTDKRSAWGTNGDHFS
ncbi:hypothetical protein ACROYT_G017987 [Oculina patagonica]